MIRQLLTSTVLAAGTLTLAACAGEGEWGVTYSQPGVAYYEPGPPVGFYEGDVYYNDFDTYWHRHRHWDRDHAYREWERHVRERREHEHREHERHEH